MKQRLNSILLIFMPRLQDIVFIAVFVSALLAGSQMLNLDGDLGRDLALGNYILAAHQVPSHDLFSFTKLGQPRPPYEWLAQLLFAIAYHWLNLDSIILLVALVIGATFFIVYYEASRQSQIPLTALILTLWAAIASSIHWLTRPHIFSFLLFAIWVSWLERVRKEENLQPWFFPLLMLIWVNTHGDFIFGILAWLAYFAGWLWEYAIKSTYLERGKKLLFAGTTSLIATGITPDLWHNWDAVLNNRSTYILERTAETMPPNFSIPNFWPFAGLMVLAIILLILNRKHIAASHVFLLAGLAASSLVIARNIPLAAIAATPILATWISQSATPKLWSKIEASFSRIDKSLLGFFWPALFILAAIGLLAHHYSNTHATIYNFSPKIFPAQATDWLETHPMQGNMFNDFNWGGYLLYRLWPTQRVFIDSQSDFYGAAFIHKYSDIYNGGPDWDEELTQYKVSWMIVPVNSAIALAAQASDHWKIDYSDKTAVIFERK